MLLLSLWRVLLLVVVIVIACLPGSLYASTETAILEFPGNPSLLPPESGARYITDTWAHQPSSTQYMLASNGLYKIQLWSFSTILDYRPANISHNPDKSRPKVFAQFYDKGYLVFSDDQQLFKVPRSNFSNTEVLLLKDQWHDTEQCTIQNMDVDGKNQLAFVICSKSGSMLVVDLAHMQVKHKLSFSTTRNTGAEVILYNSVSQSVWIASNCQENTHTHVWRVDVRGLGMSSTVPVQTATLGSGVCLVDGFIDPKRSLPVFSDRTSNQLIGMEDDCTWNSRRTVALPSSPIRSVVDVKGNQVFLVGPSSGGSAKVYRMCLYDQMEVVEEAIWEDSLTATPAGVSFDVDNSILSVYGSEQPTIYRFFMLPDSRCPVGEDFSEASQLPISALSLLALILIILTNLVTTNVDNTISTIKKM